MSTHLEIAITAARAAGRLLREHFGKTLHVNEYAAHDIKLELDVRCQTLITQIILDVFPDHAIYGEEGMGGNASSAFQWVIDPIDGTVNFFYGIPHFCVSIAVRERDGGQILAGVIYDPMRDELFAAAQGQAATLNGQPMYVSQRAQLSECIVSVGLAKVTETIHLNLPVLTEFIHRVRKARMMGSAALDMAYVACGRLDAYVEAGISLWDVAAGILLVGNAGGLVKLTPRQDKEQKYSIVATSGRVPELSNVG